MSCSLMTHALLCMKRRNKCKENIFAPQEHPWEIQIKHANEEKLMHYLSACFRSAMMSSTSSSPTEILTRPSETPIRCRSSGGMEACVMVAGCEMSVSTPPRLSANAQSFTRLRNFFALERLPRSNEII